MWAASDATLGANRAQTWDIWDIVNVNDGFNVWKNHWRSQFRPKGPPFTPLSTDEASVTKCLAWRHKADLNAHRTTLWLRVRCATSIARLHSSTDFLVGLCNLSRRPTSTDLTTAWAGLLCLVFSRDKNKQPSIFKQILKSFPRVK